MMESYWAKCEVYEGQFSNEFALVIQAHNGKRFSLFADRSEVRTDTLPNQEQPGLGWVLVQEIKGDEAYSLILLPRSTIENGQCITVSRSLLKKAQSSAKLASYDPVEC